MAEKTFQPLLDFINSNRKFIICAHESPDADAIGSQIAFYNILRKMNKQVLMINSDNTPNFLTFLDEKKEIIIFKDENDFPDDINEYCLFVMDTNDKENIGIVFNHLYKKISDYFIIDHHDYTQDLKDKHFIKVSSSSTCEIIYQLYLYLKMKISKDIAMALYTGILYDTGSFHYPKTSEETFLIAADLVKLGANPYFVYNQLFEKTEVEAFILNKLIISSLELYDDNQIAIQQLTQKMLKQTGAAFEMGEGAINQPLRCDGIKVSILYKQNLQGKRRISIRSKGNINVVDLAISYGGGGHKNAAGFSIDKNFSEFIPELLNKIRKIMAEA